MFLRKPVKASAIAVQMWRTMRLREYKPIRSLLHFTLSLAKCYQNWRFLGKLGLAPLSNKSKNFIIWAKLTGPWSIAWCASTGQWCRSSKSQSRPLLTPWLQKRSSQLENWRARWHLCWFVQVALQSWKQNLLLLDQKPGCETTNQWRPDLV